MVSCIVAQYQLKIIISVKIITLNCLGVTTQLTMTYVCILLITSP